MALPSRRIAAEYAVLRHWCSAVLPYLQVLPYCCCSAGPHRAGQPGRRTPDTPHSRRRCTRVTRRGHDAQPGRSTADHASLLHKVHHASRGRARARPAAPRQAARRPRGPVMTKAPPSIGLSPPFSCAVVPWHCRPAVLPQSTPFCGIGVLPFCRTCKYCRIAAAVPGRIARASLADGPPTRRTAAGGARESHDEATTHSRGDQPPIQHQAQLPPR